MKLSFEVLHKYRLAKQFITDRCPLNCFTCPFKALDQYTDNKLDFAGKYGICLLEGGDVLQANIDYDKFSASQLIIQTTAPSVIESPAAVLDRATAFVLPQIVTAEDSLTLLGRNIVAEQEEAVNILQKLGKKIIFTTLLDDTNIDSIIDNYYHAQAQGGLLAVKETDISLSAEEKQYLKYLISKKDVIAAKATPGGCLYSLDISFNPLNFLKLGKFLIS